jgi:prepilin signal peptidase PulO-like enzyme (type II secretory pathway)
VAISGAQILQFGLWLVLLVGLAALFVYDLRWRLLPDRIVYPLAAVAAAEAITTIVSADRPLRAGWDVVGAVIIGGGLFYVLYQVSRGKWIGGGDVKLGWLLGLVVATPARAALLIFLAAGLGSLASRRLKTSSTIAFGPFLIIAAVIVQLFGQSLLMWYRRTFLP